MKRRSLAVLMILALALLGLSGCSGSEDETVYGEISKIDGSTITINVGTMQEVEKDESSKDPPETGNETGGEGDAGGQPPSMLDLTGEEQEITITEDTVYTRQGMGGGQPEGGQKAPENQKDENKEDPPQKPEGEESDSSSGDGSAAAEAEEEELALEDFSTGDTISITFDDEGNAKEIVLLSMGNGAGGDSAPDSYQAETEYTTDTEEEGKSYRSVGTDENAIHVYKGANAILKKIKVTRKSSDSTGGDNSSFYGVGAAVLTTDGTTSISGSSIRTNAAGAAGIFAYGEGTVYTADTKITTTKDTSGGIHAAGGGALYAWDMDVETNGESSAAIRSDRGGGTMVVDGGTYTSKGTNSPAIYSTADIAVNNADLTAESSEAVCIEGLNSLRLYDSDLTGDMPDNEQNDCTWNVILYQSMSGDSEVGNSTFEMRGGTLTGKNGGMFYTTNTESTFLLSDVDITYPKNSDFFLKCTGNSNARGWGQSGSNGADCLFTAIKQTMKGDVLWDSISQLDFYMTENSVLKGAVTQDESNAGDGGDGYCNLYIEKGSTWIVTGNSALSQLSCAGTIKDAKGNKVTIKGTDGTTYVKGSSDYTITVDSYKTSADVSGASKATAWSKYETEKPDSL